MFAAFYTSGHSPEQWRWSFVVFNVGWIHGLNNDLLHNKIGIQIGKYFCDRLVSCCSAYSIIKCCYCETIRVNTSLVKSASIGYCLKIIALSINTFVYHSISNLMSIFDPNNTPICLLELCQPNLCRLIISNVHMHHEPTAR